MPDDVIIPPFVSYENLSVDGSELSVVWEGMGADEIGPAVELAKVWPDLTGFTDKATLLSGELDGVLTEWETSKSGRKWGPADIQKDAKYIRPKTSGGGLKTKVHPQLRMRKV